LNLYTSRTYSTDAMHCVSTMAILFCMILLFTAHAYAEITTTTPNGVTLRTETFFDRTELFLTCFTDFSPGTDTYVFNEAGESDVNAGKINIDAGADKIEVKVKLTTLGSTSMTVGVFGKSKNDAAWGLLYDKIYTLITPTGEDDYFPILEEPQDFRVAIKSDTPGTDSVTITVDIRRDIQ